MLHLSKCTYFYTTEHKFLLMHVCEYVFMLTGHEDGGYMTTPLDSGDGLQSDTVLCGARELSHAVGGGCGAEHHLLHPCTRTNNSLTSVILYSVNTVAFIYSFINNA